MNNTLTIFIPSFDGYSDVWPAFFSCFNKYWSECPYKVKLVSNCLTYMDVETIHTDEKLAWSSRVSQALNEVDTPYVLLMLEDYLIGKNVNGPQVEKALRFLMEQNGNYMRLTNIPKSTGCAVENDIFCIPKNEEYGINLQAAIWKKSFLMDSLDSMAGSPWEFEVGFLREAVKADQTPLDGCYVIKGEPLNIHNGILKGKWFPKEIRFLKKQGINIDFKKRGRVSFFENFKYQLRIFVKNRVSYKSRKVMKRIFRKMGAKFVSDI